MILDVLRMYSGCLLNLRLGSQGREHGHRSIEQFGNHCVDSNVRRRVLHKRQMVEFASCTHVFFLELGKQYLFESSMDVQRFRDLLRYGCG